MTNYRFYSRYRIGLCTLRSFLQNTNETLALPHVESLFMSAAVGEWDGYFRKEPYYHLARFCRTRQDFRRCVAYATAGHYAPPVDYARVPLFLETAIYSWGIEEELAYCLLQVGRNDTARFHYRRLIENAADLAIPADALAGMKSVLAQYLS